MEIRKEIRKEGKSYMKISPGKRRFLVLVIALVMVFSQSSMGFAASSKVLKTPSVKTATLDENTGNVKISWSKISGANGYQIYRAEPGTSFKRIASVKGSKTSYVDKNAPKGKTVRYKIRAFQKIKGKTKYSKFSSVKNMIIWAEVETLPFDALLEESSEEHKREQTDKVSFNGFTDYLVSGSEYQNLLSEEEIKSLRDQKGARTAKISYKKAVSDVELFFRTLKYAYGAYFYFGGEERFSQAEKEVMAALKGKTEIQTSELERQLKKSLSFVRDGHFGVNGSAIENKAVRYEYFYSGVYFSKDEHGYYKEADGKKWYYASCTDKKARIEPALTSGGDVKYSLVLFCPTVETDLKDSITLKADENTMSMSVRWTQSEALRNYSSRVQDYVFEKQDGISYISIRSFDTGLDQTIFKKYENSAKEAKGSKLVIYDIRSNGGGGNQYARNWVENFTGEVPVLNGAFSHRWSALSELRYASPGEERYTYGIETGKFIKNEIPVIVLVDDHCGSSGEGALLFAKSMDNVIVIGSNSSGCELCGNVSDYKLPDTGIRFSMPVSLKFHHNMNNVDGIGYEPDIWCNPKDALEAAYHLIIKSGYADESTVEKLKAKVEASTADEIILKWEKNIVHEGTHFGHYRFNENLTVLCNGKKISDYEVDLEDASFGTISKNKNGTINIKTIKKGRCALYIEYKGQKHTFYLRSELSVNR